jgi:hypothetical protein
MRPELMGGRRGGRRAGTPGGMRTPEGQQTAAAPARPEPSAEAFAGWARLRHTGPHPETRRAATDP